jgi:negative regulator of sigma E activity
VQLFAVLAGVHAFVDGQHTPAQVVLVVVFVSQKPPQHTVDPLLQQVGLWPAPVPQQVCVALVQQIVVGVTAPVGQADVPVGQLQPVQVPGVGTCPFGQAATHVSVPPVGVQGTNPLRQVQVLATQLAFGGQALRQLPQFAGLLVRSTQDPKQLVRGKPQVVEQIPLEQTWPDGQTLPQLPQFEVSVKKLTHFPAHSFCPGGHSQTQVWVLRIRPPVQAP